MYNQRKQTATFLGSLHPSSLMTYLTVVMIWAILASHPLLLLFLLLMILAGIALSGGATALVRSSRGLVLFALPILVINVFINDMGSTVLWSGPAIASLGRLNVTLENLAFSVVMLIRLAVTLSAFTLFNLVMDPDRALGAVTKIFPRSGLLVALTAKTIPQLLQDLRRIAEVQRCRGVDYERGTWLLRLRSRWPLFKVLLTSALEGSFTLAESMQARAYGSGPRTGYFREIFRPRDFMIVVTSGLTLAGLLVGWGRGWFAFEFYPLLGKLLPSGGQLTYLLIMACLLGLPILLAWGWGKWHSLKWRI